MVTKTNYKTQEFFKGRDKQYTRWELKRIYVELPQNKRTVDAVFGVTGVPKYHIKGLMDADDWKSEAEKEDEFKIIAKRSETDMMSEENRKQFLEAKYLADKKLFNASMDILNSDDFIEKIKTAANDAETIKDIKELYKLLMDIQDNYRNSIGLGRPDKVNLTQNNYYDLRDTVRDQIYGDEPIVIENE